MLWSDYTETDVQAVVMQLNLLEQTLDTLAEFVQAKGQTALRVHCVCTACALRACDVSALHAHLHRV